MPSEFLIPVGKSPIPPARAALALHPSYIPILVCNEATQSVAETVKSFLQQKISFSTEIIICSDENEESSKDGDLFSKYRGELSMRGEIPNNVLIGPGAKWFCTAIALSNPEMKYWVIEERYSKSQKNVSLPRIRRLSGISKVITIEKIGEEDILLLHGLSRPEPGILIGPNDEELSYQFLVVNSISGKIELSFSPPDKDLRLKGEPLKRAFRRWEKNLNKTRSDWEDCIGKHGLVFILSQIIVPEKTKKRWSRFMKRLTDRYWIGGIVKCK